MTPEQTRKQHVAQRDMVVRSLLVAPTRSDRSEERPRRRVEPRRAAWAMPVVNERKPL